MKLLLFFCGLRFRFEGYENSMSRLGWLRLYDFIALAL